MQLAIGKKLAITGIIPVLLAVSRIAYAQELTENVAQPDIDLSPVELPEQPIDLAQAVSPQTNTAPKTAASPIPGIITTRPSFTDSWVAIPKGSFQAENGVAYINSIEGTHNWNLPESLLKVGIGANTEFRFGVPTYLYSQDDDEGALANNFGDITAGFSHHLRLPKKINLAIISFLNIPTGANNVSSNSLDPQLRVVVAKYLKPKFVVASQLDTRWNTGKNASSNVVMNPTLIGYYSFTNKLVGFLEYGGFYPTEGRNLQFIQSGALYFLTPRQQLDVRVATGLNKYSSDFIVGFGYSFRLDHLFGQ